MPDDRFNLYGLVKAYILAMKIGDDGFGQAISSTIKEIYETHSMIPGSVTLRLLYNSIKEDCELKRNLVELYSDAGATLFKGRSKGDRLPHGYLMDLVTYILQERHDKSTE
jgi:hypothetical protein